MTEIEPLVSVIVPCYTEARWDDTVAAIQSSLSQTLTTREIVVVVDHNPDLRDRLGRAFPELTVVENRFERGASGNRNSGALAARGEIVAFLDDDHIAAPDWLEALCSHVGRPGVLGVGGRATPRWPAQRPAWFPDEFAWVVGATYRGMPEEPSVVRNVWSGNMALSRDRFLSVGGFRVGFGKVNSRSRPEDTDFCIRLAQQFPGDNWLYEPAAVIEHQVPPERASMAFFIRRCWAEGLGKAELRQSVGDDATTTEREYVRRVLPVGAIEGVRDTVSGRDRAGVARSSAIVTGLTVTAAGMVTGRLTHPPASVSRRADPVSGGSARDQNPDAGRAAPSLPDPVQVDEVEITERLGRLVRRDLPAAGGADSDDQAVYSAVLLLVRLQGHPVGTVRIPFVDGELSAVTVAEAVWAQLGPEIRSLFAAEGLDPPSALPVSGLQPTADLSWRVERDKVLADPPAISVVLATRNRPEEAIRCLAALDRQMYRNFEVIVVDNAPSSNATRDAVEAARPFNFPCRYLHEPRPGLSWARNAGVAAAEADLIAFLDDDERADVWWLAEIARGFKRSATVGCVSGLVFPAELDSPPQHWFEEFGGHSKGRGFRPDLFDATAQAAQSPLYPLPPFGVGANMAMRKAVLVEIGGFDVSLGAGTPTKAGEDTLAFSKVLLAGWQMVYAPAAIMHHYHRSTDAQLRDVFLGYGTGLTAFYLALLRDDPKLVVPLLKLLPQAARDLFGADSQRTVSLTADFPKDLLGAQRSGMLRGPVALVRSARRQRMSKRASG